MFILANALPVARGATRVWIGLGSDPFWTTPGNWQGGLFPAASDDVLLLSGQTTSNDNLRTNLNSISFGAGGFLVIGSLWLTNGVNATNSSGANVLDGLIDLGANQSFTNLNSGTELLFVNLDMKGKGATFRGAGTNAISNVIEDTVGGGSLTNNGTGVFLFVGTNSNFTGPMALNAGTNLFTGFQSRSPITWTAGTLGGTGHLGQVTAFGTSAKRLVPGYTAGPGVLNTTALVLNSNVTVVMRVNGTNAGVDFDQILANGNVTLTNAALSLSFATNLSPVVGTTFTLINPTVLISGQFAGLPEGSMFTNNHVVYQLTYDSGNDVTLTVSAVLSAGGSVVWSGAGTNDSWMNPANWVLNVAPQQGQALLFQPFSAVALTNSNDFPPDTTFDSIHFQIPQIKSTNLALLGNPVRLNNGVRLEPTSLNQVTGGGNYTVSNYISLNFSQTFSNGITGNLHLAGGVALENNTLTVQGGGVSFDAPITGGGVFNVAAFGSPTLNASNAITGSIEVGGVLIAQHPQALGSAATGPVHVGANGSLELALSNTTYTGSSIVLTGALKALSTNIVLTAPLVVAGSNALIAPGSLSPFIEGSLTLSGPVTNSMRFTNSSGFFGPLHIAPGTVVQGGGLLVNSGTLDADGIIHNTVLLGGNADGFLSGAGQIDSVSSINPASITPGSASLTNLAYNPLGIGTLVMDSSTILVISLFPNRPGGGPTNTMLIVTNPPTLGNAGLSLTNLAPLAPNQQFTILRNLSSAPVTNTLLNLPEGTFLGSHGGNLGLRISYVGGAGHDVVLTVQSNTPPKFANPTVTNTVNELSSFVYSNAITDLEPGETFSWTLVPPFPSGVALNPTNGVLSWIPQEGQAPSTNVILCKVTDSGTPAMSSTGTVVVIVQEINQAPVPVPVPLMTIFGGSNLTLQLQATDADVPPQPLTWTKNSGPTNASVTSGGLFTYASTIFETGLKTNILRVCDSDPGAVNSTSLCSNLTVVVQVVERQIVTNTNNFGIGSLSNAIALIATNPLGGHIEFNIPGTGPFKIAPTSPLPELGANTLVDGYTQPGSQLNSNAIGTGAKIMIELSGENLASSDGLNSTVDGIVIRGLCINRFTNGNYAINFHACCGSACGNMSGCAIEGCFIGTDTTGTNALPNTFGVSLGCVSSSRLGGPDPSQRNLISSSVQDAVEAGGHLSGLTIQNNLIGTDRTGTNAMPNGGRGINLGTDNGTFSCTVADNVICDNGLYAIQNNANNTVIVRNKIGVGADGLTPLGNAAGLIFGGDGSGHLVGGTNIADANTIAYSSGIGVDISLASLVSVLGNSIFRNTGRAIQLDSGNNGQGAPVLTNATLGSGSVNIKGTLTSNSNTTYRLEFFHNPDFLPGNQPQAWIFLGSTNLTTGSSSNASFAITFNQTLTGGFVTATATDPAGNTSGISSGLALPSAARLNITLSNNLARVFWLTNLTAFTLQSNGNIILPSGWADVPTPYGTTGSNFFRDFAPSGPPLFFRLRSP
ncbi:MAG: hypothetical protein C5B50_29860 [Verrucomicrobia bacterium]|nr:MAG: hypothetical protein C5B50_29860 [Verrucomicrobiota bacterium]